MLEGIISLDISTELFLNNLYNPSLYAFFKFITGFGAIPVAVIVFACIAYYLWGNRDMALSKRLGLFFGLNYFTVFFIKWFINRPRPYSALFLGETGASFPSGHAAASIFIYGFLIYYLSKKMTSSWKKRVVVFLLFILIILIGFSRLYLGVHFLSDVIGGYLLGALFLSLLLRSKN